MALSPYEQDPRRFRWHPEDIAQELHTVALLSGVSGPKVLP